MGCQLFTIYLLHYFEGCNFYVILKQTLSSFTAFVTKLLFTKNGPSGLHFLIHYKYHLKLCNNLIANAHSSDIITSSPRPYVLNQFITKFHSRHTKVHPSKICLVKYEQRLRPDHVLYWLAEIKCHYYHTIARLLIHIHQLLIQILVHTSGFQLPSYYRSTSVRQ